MRKQILTVVVLFPIFGGCAASRTALKPTFWDTKTSKIGVVVTQYPEPGAYKTGAQGLLDIAVNNAMASSLETYLRTLSLKGFDDEADLFVDSLAKRGMAAKKIAGDPLDVKTLASKKNRADLLQQIAGKENVDRLIVLSVQAAGTSRPYYGFIPLGAPQGYCRTKGEMFDLAHQNDVLWETDVKSESTLVAIEPPWGEPPSYPHITKSFQEALENGKRFLMADFFGQDQTKN